MRAFLQKTLLTLASVFVVSQSAYAVFDLQVFTGSGQSQFFLEQSELEQDQIKSQDSTLGITLHFNPMESLPVAIGLGYQQETPVLKYDKSGRYRSITGGMMSLEILSWLPMGGYALYGKIGQVLSGGYKVKLTENAAVELGESPIKEYEYEGRYLALGIGIAAAPGMGIFSEVRGKIGGKLTEVVDPVDPLGLGLVAGETAMEGSIKSLNLMVGIEMGI